MNGGQPLIVVAGQHTLKEWPRLALDISMLDTIRAEEYNAVLVIRSSQIRLQHPRSAKGVQQCPVEKQSPL
jgi:hypothetical protein